MKAAKGQSQPPSPPALGERVAALEEARKNLEKNLRLLWKVAVFVVPLALVGGVFVLGKYFARTAAGAALIEFMNAETRAEIATATQIAKDLARDRLTFHNLEPGPDAAGMVEGYPLPQYALLGRGLVLLRGATRTQQPYSGKAIALLPKEACPDKQVETVIVGSTKGVGLSWLLIRAGTCEILLENAPSDVEMPWVSLDGVVFPAGGGSPAPGGSR